MKTPIYSVFCPEFEITSGGIRVMWGLYAHLLARGEVAIANMHTESLNYTAIYPEVVADNPFMASKVVRYILQTPGVMSMYGASSPTTQDFQNKPGYKNDKFYVFSQVYNTMGVDDDHILFLPIINTRIFRKTSNGKKRTKTCFLVGKGVMGDKHPPDAIELTREFAQDQQALADLLNECEVLYCYDRLSAMMEVARLCGCRVEYYGELPLSELKKYEPGLNGVGYKSHEELDTKAFTEEYHALKETFDRKLDLFIQDTA